MFENRNDIVIKTSIMNITREETDSKHSHYNENLGPTNQKS